MLADLSASMLAKDGVIDVTPLEDLDWSDVATARRSAYRYRDLMLSEDRELVTRSYIPYDVTSQLPYDNRQPAVNTWAMDLDAAIGRAFAGPFQRLQLRLRGRKEPALD